MHTKFTQSEEQKLSNSLSNFPVHVMFWQNTKQESPQLPKAGGQASKK